MKINIDTFKESLKESRTSKLWLEYINMITLLCNYISAERTGNWLLHLQCVRQMLPYLAAAGHNHYTKSGSLYLQSMLQLNENNPDVFRAFVNGNHVIRRSDRYWAGISSDLTIEQVLMRSLKTNGGLTRGEGFAESQRAIWVLAMPAMAEINSSMQEFTNVDYYTNEQHKECTHSTLKRDNHDVVKLLSFLEKRNSFSSGKELRNIVNGITSLGNVNVENYRDIGEFIMETMYNQSIDDYVYKRKKQAVSIY